jgi:hypothetical protein
MCLHLTFQSANHWPQHIRWLWKGRFELWSDAMLWLLRNLILNHRQLPLQLFIVWFRVLHMILEHIKNGVNVLKAFINIKNLVRLIQHTLINLIDRVFESEISFHYEVIHLPLQHFDLLLVRSCEVGNVLGNLNWLVLRHCSLLSWKFLSVFGIQILCLVLVLWADIISSVKFRFFDDWLLRFFSFCWRRLLLSLWRVNSLALSRLVRLNYTLCDDCPRRSQLRNWFIRSSF